MAISKRILFALLVVNILLFACSEKTEIDSPVVDGTESMISFDTHEDHSAERKKVSAMSLDERIKYEDSKGYRSFGTKCEEVYFSADLDNMNDDQIREFVNANDEYLELVEEDGEIYLETELSKCSDVYFINRDKMFKVAGSTIKVIDNNTSVSVSCDENLEELMQLNRDNLHRVEGNENFKVNTIERVNLLKANGCLNSITKRETTNRDRIKADLTCNVAPIEGVPYMAATIRFELRPYKRTLGIWYWCSRTLSYSVKAACSYHILVTGVKETFYLNKDRSAGVSSSYINEYTERMWSATTGNTTVSVEFEAYDCWGASASVNNRAIISCNAAYF